MKPLKKGDPLPSIIPAPGPVFLIGILLAVLLITLQGCETGARYLLAAVDPCADCYLEPPGQVGKCLEACEAAEDPPDTTGLGVR